jgi:hypothetical protein
VFTPRLFADVAAVVSFACEESFIGRSATVNPGTANLHALRGFPGYLAAGKGRSLGDSPGATSPARPMWNMNSGHENQRIRAIGGIIKKKVITAYSVCGGSVTMTD